MGVIQKRKRESGKRGLVNLREMVHAKAQRRKGDLGRMKLDSLLDPALNLEEGEDSRSQA